MHGIAQSSTPVIKGTLEAHGRGTGPAREGSGRLPEGGAGMKDEQELARLK